MLGLAHTRQLAHRLITDILEQNQITETKKTHCSTAGNEHNPTHEMRRQDKTKKEKEKDRTELQTKGRNKTTKNALGN